MGLALAHLPAAELPIVLKWPAAVAGGGILLLTAASVRARTDAPATGRAAAATLFPWGGLLLLAALSRAWSIAPHATDRFLAGLAACVLWAVAGALLPPASARRAGAGLVAGGAALVLLALRARWEEGVERAATAMGNPNFVASYLAACLPLAVDLLLTARDGRGRLLPTVGIGLLLMGLGDLESRGALVGAAVGLFLYAVARADLSLRARSALLAGGPVALAAAVLVLAPGRLEGLLDPATGTPRFRLETWRAGLGLAAERPWTGWGAGTFPLAYPPFRSRWVAAVEPDVLTDNAHSEAVQWAVETGLPGAATAAWLVVFVATAGLRGGRVAPAAAFVALAVSNLFGTDLRWGATTWAFGLLGGLAVPLKGGSAGAPPVSDQPGGRSRRLVAAAVAAAAVATAASLTPVAASVHLAEGLRVVRDAAAKGTAEAWRAAYGPGAASLDAAALLDPSLDGLYFRANLEADAVGAGVAGASAERSRAFYARARAHAPHFAPLLLRAASTEEETGARLAILRRVVALEPYGREGLARTADLLAGAGRFSEAEAFARALAAVEPGVSRHVVNAAFARSRAGDLAGAVRILERARPWHPADGEILFALGALRHEAGDAEGARAAWGAALEVEPGHARAAAALAATAAPVARR